MTETFNLPLKVGASGSEKLGVNKVQFGDGYESRASNGLNNQTSEWSVSITGDNEKLIPYIEFLANHGGVRSFCWTPPSGEKGLFTAEEWKTDTLGAGIYTLSTTFTRVHSAGPIETRAIEIIEGGGALIDDTKPSLASTYSSSKTEEVIKATTDTAIDALKKEENPFTQYAKQKDLDSVKTTANAAATQAELKKTNDKVASLEKVKPVLTVNGTAPDEKGNISITVSSDATEQINTAIDALKREDDPFTQYAKQTDLDNVKKTADAAATQTELKKTNDKVADLENVKPVLTVNGTAPDEKGNIKVASEINDTATAKNSTWSSQQISDNVDEKLKDLKDLPEKVAALEKTKFIILYPNGGTKESPANITTNKRYIEDNPFPNSPVICQLEIYYSGVWGTTGWILSGGGWGAIAGHNMETDKIIIQTGSSGIAGPSNAHGNTLGTTGTGITNVPCRVKIWRTA